MTHSQRFWAKVDKTGSCWIWRGSLTPKGYGRFTVMRRYIEAHHFAYEDVVGPTPEGKQLDHLCRNPSCVRPDHLEPVTQRENLLRGDTLAAKNAAKTHCPQGHEYTEENTRVGPDRKRYCRACVKERSRQRRNSFAAHPFGGSGMKPQHGISWMCQFPNGALHCQKPKTFGSEFCAEHLEQSIALSGAAEEGE